jgi:hypothetical protein
VPAPPIASLGAGWLVVDEDSEGELGARIEFEEWTGPAKASQLAADWGGDRSVLATDGERAAFAWILRYDPAVGAADSAGRAFAAVAEAVARGKARPPVAKGTSFACAERTDRGPIAVAYAGRTLVMTLGPARTSVARWSSAATCGLARSWTREILAYASR